MTLLLHLFFQLLASTLFAVGALAFVVFPAMAVSAVHKLGGVSLGELLRFLPMTGIELAPYLISLGFLLAVVSTFGRLAADKEWVAIQMAGIHPLRMMLPGLLLAAGLGALTYKLASDVSPRWKVQQRQLSASARANSFRRLAPGRTEIEFDSFYLSAVEREGNVFRDVQIQLRDTSEASDEAGAREGDMFLVAKELELTVEGDVLFVDLQDYTLVTESSPGVGRERHKQGGQRIAPRISDFIEERPIDTARAKYRTSAQIRAALSRGEVQPEKLLENRFMLHSRIAVAFTYLVFLLIGVPTGLWLRSGGQLSGLGFAALYAFSYYILSLRLGGDLAQNGTLPPWLAAWTTNLIGMLIGAVLLFRTVRR